MDFHPRFNMLLATCINPGTQKLRLAGEPCCAVLRYVMPCRAVLHCAALRCVAPCRAVLCRAVLC